MPFKKLHSDIREKLDDLEIITPTPFQSKCIPIIKSGTNLFCTAPKDCGKTTTLIKRLAQKTQLSDDNSEDIQAINNKRFIFNVIVYVGSHLRRQN